MEGFHLFFADVEGAATNKQKGGPEWWPPNGTSRIYRYHFCSDCAGFFQPQKIGHFRPLCPKDFFRPSAMGSHPRCIPLCVSLGKGNSCRHSATGRCFWADGLRGCNPKDVLCEVITGIYNVSYEMDVLFCVFRYPKDLGPSNGRV